jgi:AraC family transcriptional regulator
MHVMKRPELSTGLAKIAAHLRANPGDHVDLRQLAGLAGFSPYHFHRVFRAVFGEPLGAYVRRERLQRAAAALRTGTQDVTAIALDAGYDSPSAFTRAFSDHFGLAPTEFRSDTSAPIVPEHALPRFRSRDMTFRIIEFSPRRLLGVRRTGSYGAAAPAAFEALVAIAQDRGLIGSATEFIGLSYGSPETCDEADLQFDACISSAAPPVGELRVIESAGGAYAVYRHAGPHHFVEHVFDRLFDAVIFSGRYELRDAPCMEINLNDPGTTAPADLLTDVCIPIA